MSDLVAILCTTLIPITSLTSLTIYLSIHPSSPLRHLIARRRIALPTYQDEALDGTSSEKEEDPFNLEDPVICDDGTPVEPGKFWASMWRRKIAFLLSLLPPFGCNILLLIYSAVEVRTGDEQSRDILLPILLIPAHLVAVLLGCFHLRQRDTPSHWSTTIHLSANLFVQFVVLAIFALLPSTPLPSTPPAAPSLLLATFARLALFALPSLRPINILKPLLPILHIPPLLLILSVPRGPPLYLALHAIYPAKITNAVPADAAALDPGKTNVTQEVQATVPEWLLFSYATDVIRKGYVAESMDVWDLPILQASMREASRAYDWDTPLTKPPGALPRYRKMRKVYGRANGRFGKGEGFNLLWKLARANSGALTARKAYCDAHSQRSLVSRP